MVANHVPLRNFGKSAVYEIDSQTLPNTCYLTAPTRINFFPAFPIFIPPSFTNRAPCVFGNCGCGGKFVLLSLLPHIYRLRPFFGDVFALRVRLRPPEMAIVVVIGAVWRYWEGDFVSGG